MVNLLFRSILVLSLLFGLLFAVGMGIVAFFGLPIMFAVIMALGILLLQFILGPKILEFIYKIEWMDATEVDLNLGKFLVNTCASQEIPLPRFGLIRDGNPNAFTFGHYPGNARLVITTGLLKMLNRDEREAVIAHELGHIVHWDFVVMTIAASVPLILYVVYSFTSRFGGDDDDGFAYALIVAVISYIAYILSHYIVLLLSRVREYYADQFSGNLTRDPDALSTALVKIAYGMAAIKDDDDKKDDARMIAGRAFGIFDPKVAQSLALVGAGEGIITADAMEQAMKWDLWNPWAGFYEISSSHPLPAKRIQALERQTESLGKLPHYSFRIVQPESYWDEFLADLFINFLPAVTFILGVLFSLFIPSLGFTLLVVFLAWWLKRMFSYRHAFEEKRDIKSLISEVKVSGVRSIPCTLEGRIIGRGVPGLFYSDDLVLQDDTGFIVVDYRQPIRILEFLFGWTKAASLIGRKGKVMGWYRRSPKPYFEMRTMVFEDGETVTSYSYPFTQFFVYTGIVVGLLLTLFV